MRFRRGTSSSTAATRPREPATSSSSPEAARALAQKGAEIIFLPIWGGDVKLAKARAIENQVYLVSSTYDMITAVFDQEGEVMKEATNDNPVVVCRDRS